jgi:hypothetical protein
MFIICVSVLAPQRGLAAPASTSDQPNEHDMKLFNVNLASAQSVFVGVLVSVRAVFAFANPPGFSAAKDR